jgi:hypothetical protein
MNSKRMFRMRASAELRESWIGACGDDSSEVAGGENASAKVNLANPISNLNAAGPSGRSDAVDGVKRRTVIASERANLLFASEF